MAQPFFDVLGREPLFFVVHRFDRLGVIGLALALVLLPPLILLLVEGVLGRLRPSLGRLAHTGSVGLLGAVLALQVLKVVEAALPAPVLLLNAGLLGAAAALAYRRWEAVRSTTSLLALAALLFPLLFLGRPGVLQAAPPAVAAGPEGSSTRPPVVFVVMDEFPTQALLDRSRHIDPSLFPNFAALAREATWYREATSGSSSTPTALPQILTGVLPAPTPGAPQGQMPVLADYPSNLFTLLAPGYRMEVSESVTAMCPAHLVGSAPPDEVLARMAADLSVLGLHLLLPREMTVDLPDVENGWGPGSHGAVGEEQLRLFIEGVRNPTEPTLYFAHVVLPHAPWTHNPSGSVRSFEPEPFSDVWAREPWNAAQGFQAHLLQAAWMDRRIGALVQRMKETGLWDRALLVITADHGMSFRPGHDSRSPKFPQDLMYVPTFVKYPGQREGVLDDRPVETVDLLPTVADLAGLPVGSVEGFSLRGPEVSGRTERRFVGQGLVRLPLLVPGRDDLLEYKLDLFGEGGGEAAIYRMAPGPRRYFGREAREVEADPAAVAHLEHQDAYWQVQPSSGRVPSGAAGTVTLPEGQGGPREVAVLVNGRVEAQTLAWNRPGDPPNLLRFSALLPESSLRPGANQVSALVLR